MRFDIEPKIGLGNFILGMNINQVLTFIKRNGYYFKNCKIITNKEKNSPIFLHIPSELITLRFNYYTQNLELIEKKIIFDTNNNNIIESDNDSEYYYKNKLFYMQNKKNEYHILKYQNIAQLFGLSKVPKKINQNKNIFLEYSGIGFYFSNEVIDFEKSEEIDISSDPSSIDTNSILSKFFIFKKDSLYDSLSKNNIFETNNMLIKYDSSKAKSISIKRNDDSNKSVISIGDNIEDVLRELKNPNYIYYSNENNETYNQAKDNGDVLYNQTSNKIFYLNYFNYGFDIMICNNKVNRIILHTNQIGDSKFGIYERCNFKLKLRKDYLTTLLKAEYKIYEKNEEIKKDLISNEKEKNKPRKNSQNEKIQINDKKDYKDKDEKESNDKLKKIEINNSKNKDNLKEKEIKIQKDVLDMEKERENQNLKIKEKEEIKNNNQNNNNKNETKTDKKDNKKNLEKEEEKNIKKNNNKNDNNISDEKNENIIKKDYDIKSNNENNITSSNENLKVDNKNTENDKGTNIKNEKIKDDSSAGEKMEKDQNEIEDKKDEDKREEKEEENREENDEDEEERKKDEERKREEEAKKEEDAKKEELAKKEEEKKREEDQKKEEESKQSQNNINTGNRNNRRKRKKHGNPPKKKKENNFDEENKESEKEDDKDKIKNEDFQEEEEEKSKNKDDGYLTIFPWTDFKEEFLNKIEYNKNLRNQKWDEGTSKIVNCYFFHGLLFEIIDKNVIGTIIIY